MIMAKAYRFDDSKPPMGSQVSAFRTLGDLKNFVRLQGGKKGTMKFWEIDGGIISDHGGPDGITIRVTSAKKVQ